MNIINKTSIENPFDWAKFNNYRETKSFRCEIYLNNIDIESVNNESLIISGLLKMFYKFFDKIKDDILIYNSSWWDLCLETWDIQTDSYNYDYKNKSKETSKYLRMLKWSNIDINYSGICQCSNWHKFLEIILNCVVYNQAPYSPIFINVESEFFFYFHASGSIGLYYKNDNELISKILYTANMEYIVEF